MRQIEYRQFEQLLRTATRAWHLELRDIYNVEFEKEPLARWLEREPDDYAWLDEWLHFIRELVASGVKVERLRVVSEPPTEYTRWSLAVTRLNVEAGEAVRYLPRHHVEDLSFPDEDCWLLDEDTLILSLFMPDGGSAGFAIESDPRKVARYRALRDEAWPRGVPFEEYRSR